MKIAIVMILAALLTSSASVPGVNLTEGSGTATDTRTDEPEHEAIFEVYEGEESQKYENDVLILMTSEDCTDEQLAKILEKYHLTLLNEGEIIPFHTVQLEEAMTEAELQKLADTIMNEDGIVSAMISYIIELELPENEYVISDQQQSFDDNTLILMTTEDCTDEQLAKILKKYHLTLLREGDIIPYCTVQLEENLTEAELQELADTIMNEEGIASAMISYISIIS